MKHFVKMLSVVFCAAIVSSAYGADEEQWTSLLRSGRFKELEAATIKMQVKFENRLISEVELRNAFRQFYDLDPRSVVVLDEWKKMFGSSYTAHLARGIYFKRRGLDARGETSIDKVPKESLEMMRRYFALAEQDLEVSLKFAAKPLLSIFHLLNISQVRGDRSKSAYLLAYANKIVPGNALVRNRYMMTLTPRWGGSYEEMELFLKKTKLEGVEPSVLMQLEAIKFDDQGWTSLDVGDQIGAIEYFSKAQELGKRVGGEFSKDFLVNSKPHICSVQELMKYCQGSN